LYRFESICKEVKFTKTVFWLCFDVMTGIKKMNKIEQKDMWANLFMKIIEQAVKRNTEVSTYHAWALPAKSYNGDKLQSENSIACGHYCCAYMYGKKFNLTICELIKKDTPKSEYERQEMDLAVRSVGKMV
jgi:hypothetical protein